MLPRFRLCAIPFKARILLSLVVARLEKQQNSAENWCRNGVAPLSESPILRHARQQAFCLDLFEHEWIDIERAFRRPGITGIP
jgi:hypothetical protein